MKFPCIDTYKTKYNGLFVAGADSKNISWLPVAGNPRTGDQCSSYVNEGSSSGWKSSGCMELNHFFCVMPACK